MLLLFVYSVFSVHVSIDFGSYFAKASIYSTTSSPEIGLNVNSERNTPSFISFRLEKQLNFTKPLTNSDAKFFTPEIGDRAITYLKTRPFLGIGFFSYFIQQRVSSFAHNVTTQKNSIQ